MLVAAFRIVAGPPWRRIDHTQNAPIGELTLTRRQANHGRRMEAAD